MRLKSASGAVAIYDETTYGDGPFTSPTTHIAQLKFHSDLGAVGVATVITGSVSLPAVTAGTFQAQADIIYTHGLAGAPMCEGKITAVNGSSVTLPLLGSVPIIQHPSTESFNFGTSRCWLVHLGADSTYVKIHAMTKPFADVSAASYSYEVWITDLLI